MSFRRIALIAVCIAMAACSKLNQENYSKIKAGMNKAEVEQWKLRDPITTFTASLEAAGLGGGVLRSALDAVVADEVARAVQFADSGTWEPVDDLARDVYTPVASPTTSGVA